MAEPIVHEAEPLARARFECGPSRIPHGIPGIPGSLAPTSSQAMISVDHSAMDVGQAEVTAGVSAGELLVIEAEELEEGRVEVMDVHLVLDRLVAQLVRSPVHVAPSRRRRPSTC